MVASSSFTAADDNLVVVGDPTYIPTISPTIDQGGGYGGDDDDNGGGVVNVSVDGNRISLDVSMIRLSAIYLAYLRCM